MEDLIMMGEIANQVFEKTSDSIKSPGEAVDVVNDMEKIIRSKKSSKVKFLKNLKRMKVL